ncbi:hypothetical protein M758_10G127600 [Ceratodon purpureus]|nr:hypothetical protein M758_10G127600 [Ceratodon purpureus]
MATGGAWESETFDNGRDFHHSTEAPPTGFATPPAMYKPSPVGKDSSAFGVIALSLRIAQIAFTLIAFSVMAANNVTIYNAYTTSDDTDTTSGYYEENIKFSRVKSFVGVVTLNCIVCFYAIVQLVQCFINMSSKGKFISSANTGFAMLTFVFDTVLAYALIAASAAGAGSAAIISADGLCSSAERFCQKAQASVAMSFFAFAVLAASAALYPVRLLRLIKG